MNILHLVYDEKFIPFTIDLFSACENSNNLFLVKVQDISSPLKYVNSTDNVRVIDRQYFRSPTMVDDLAWCDCLVVHYLDIFGAKIILSAPSQVNVVWSGWGGDYYELLPGGERYFWSDETKSLVKRMKRKELWSISNLPRLANEAEFNLKKQVFDYPYIKKAIKRVNFFSAPVPEDFYLLKSGLGSLFQASYIQLNYGSVERTFLPGSGKLMGDNILVGNSATETNNHIDIFHMLSNIELGQRKIIAPLSYGANNYRNEIVGHGYNIFGSRFEPLLKFVPLEEYNAIISSCSVVIMGHRRQQALGNICAMLYKGAKVFISEDSVIYRFFRSRGAYVAGLADLTLDNADIFTPLNESQKQNNREIIASFWGDQVVMENVNFLIDEVQRKK